MRWWGWILMGVALAGAADSTQNFGAAGNPVAVIRAKDTELQKLLREKDAGQKMGRIKELINGIFDFEELGRRALGPKLWNSMPPAQQARFVKAFRQMAENASVKKLSAYESDSTHYDPPEVQDGHTSVTAHVYSKGAESVVVYKLFQKNGVWKAWDLVIDDLSTAGNYGDQFRVILKTKTMDGLIAKLEQKAKEDAGGKAGKTVKAVSDAGAS